jgi:hypothetical protein
MTAMIDLDNLMKLRSIFKKIIAITKDAEFKNDTQQSVKIIQLLDMLVHMQSLNISIRTELIEQLFSIRPDPSHKIRNQKKKEPITILYDRRKVNPDRRKLNVHLANNRRIGIADRRKSIQNLRAEIRSH